MKTRYKKILGDLRTDYLKNLMLIIAIAIGVFGIGAILGAHAVVNREMAANYMGTVPASATIEVEPSISTGLLDSVRNFPGITRAERRVTVVARMKVNERWHPLLLFVIDDFAQLNINKFHYVSGAATPQEGEMLVERTALSVMKASQDDQVIVKTPHGTARSITISGIVHDPGLAPAWQQEAGYGYITLSTLHWLGETQGFDLLRIIVNDQGNSRGHITDKTTALADWLNRHGHQVLEIQIPPPGKHPHQGQMNAILSIFTLFSFMILALASILVATAMATLMVRQVRQIGIMKTIGASSFQVTILYMLMMLTLCVAALGIGIPLSRVGASVLFSQIAVLLNLEINDDTIPVWVSLVQAGAGVIIPFVGAAFPVIRGSRISVRKALDNYGISNRNQRHTGWDMWIQRFDSLGSTFRQSLGNAFRQRGRLILTLGLLTAGGAMFLTALNLSAAWNKTLGRIAIQRLYDHEVQLNERTNANSIIRKVRSLAGVRIVEGWDQSSTSVAEGNTYEITHTYPDEGHGSFTMVAVPLPTQLLNPTITEGQWLSPDRPDEVVLNQLARTSGMKIGNTISLTLKGKITTWKIAGFTEDIGSSATAYVSLPTFSGLMAATGEIGMLRVAYNDRSRESVADRSSELEELFERERIGVSSSTPVWLLRNAVAAHMRVLVNSLLAMAVLMAIVGTFGLMSTLSMNVLERTREIGVMRAIGATPKKVRNLIVFEALIIGILSILIAVIASLLLSYYMGSFIGHMSFRISLPLTVSSVAILLWVAIVISGSYLATLHPVNRANRISVRQALAYE